MLRSPMARGFRTRLKVDSCWGAISSKRLQSSFRERRAAATDRDARLGRAGALRATNIAGGTPALRWFLRIRGHGLERPAFADESAACLLRLRLRERGSSR